MKKSLLSVGAACLAAVSTITGCGSLEQQSPDAYLKELNQFMDKATGLENHQRQEERHLLPNASLSSSKALYVAIAGASLDAIELRYGKADELYVAKAATDPNYIGEWNALRNADADQDKAAKAAETLKGVIKKAYETYQTRNKKSVDELYASVIGAVAQQDYLFYKKQLKAGDATADDYKDQKTWLELGKKNIQRVVDEEKKVMDERAKKVEDAKKQAEADERKIQLILKYHGSRLAIPGTKAGIAALRNVLADAKLPPVLVNFGCDFLKKQILDKMVQNMADAEKEWPGVVTAISDAITPYEMPKFDAAGLNAFNAKDRILKYVDAVGSSLDAWQKKAFGPYVYAAEMFGKRTGYTFKAWSWSYESYKAYKEAAED